MTRTRGWLIIPGVDCIDHSYRILEGRQVLGRSPDCHLHLNHPTVSKHHAELLLGDEGFSVRDLGSLNGTFVDEMRIDRSALGVGQLLRLGHVTLEVVDHLRCGDGGATEVLHRKLVGALEQKAMGLSPAQLRVMHLLIEGLPEKTVAGRLHVSQNTVHTHITSIYRQLEVHSRSELLYRYFGEIEK
jgi:DNA-binding CsgD family transcriptional regulator